MLRTIFRSFLPLLFLLPALPVQAQSLALSLDAVTHPLFAAGGLRLTLASPSGGATDIEIGRLQFAGQVLERIRLHCDNLRWSPELIECPRGELVTAGSAAQRLPLRFSYAPRSQTLDIAIEPAQGERWQFRVRGSGKRREAEAMLVNARIERATGWLPLLAAYSPKGQVSGRLSWRGALAVADLRANGLSFGDAAGAHAGDRIAATVALRGEETADGWNWQAEIGIDDGEIFWQPFYLAQGGHRLSASGSARGAAVSVARGELGLVGIGKILFSGEWDRHKGMLSAARFDTGDIDLASAGPVVLKPLLEQAAVPPFRFGGTVQASGVLREGQLAALDLKLSRLSVEEEGGRYALRGVDARIPWRSDSRTEARLTAEGGSFGRLPLGPFSLALGMEGMEFFLPRAEIPLLDGKLIAEQVAVSRGQRDWRWSLGLALEPVSMERLTGVLGLPRMAGTLSAFIPRISHARSTVEMEGALIIQVFDGYVSVTNLKLIEPFGRVPRLYADLEVRHFDLGMLTETYSFGSITGYIDGDVKGLELARWRPQRFEARVFSSPGDYRKRISQRAVQNISSLGGAGAGAAIQRSFLRFFDQFGYDRLGLSCVLAEGVCEMGGVAEAPNGYVIVKGGGIPAINVIGYNRHVDWDELVSRILRVIEGNTKLIIQ
ncbi:MAG: hypothetical protein C0522_09455 [Rhodocyclaceae bacterium]|jgi:hypothetical protein|nr:hypothetical protein [Rhodocyclaceae bacterium]